MEKEFIENLYNEKAKNDSNSEDLAKTLNILSKTVFGDINRFAFELLQNADDSPNPDSQTELNVTFHLFDNYLLFSHNGKHFDENDVKGISRVGSFDSNKDKEMEKTGYKGIGFKSIFRTSDCVQIISNKYKFKFDKHHWKNDKSYPWQVIPIWSDKIPTEIEPYLDFTNVNTIINVTNNENLYSEILDVFEDCQIILFLRNVNKIQFKRANNTEFEIIKKNNSVNTCTLHYNGELKSNWFLSDFSQKIPNTLREKLLKLLDAECPSKLKEAKLTKITFAALIEADKLITLNDTVVYNYLPTKVKYEFPYIVNADFITNAERSQLLVNDWNEFLLYVIAKRQLDLLVKLADTKYKDNVLQVLKEKFTNESDILKGAFNKGLSEVINDVAFIPDEFGTKLLRPQDCLIDSLEYSKNFPKEHIIELYPNKPSIVSHNLSVPQKLLTLDASKFDVEDIERLYKSNTFISVAKSDKKFNFLLICFLYNKIKLIEILKNLKFILDSTGHLQKPKNLYFPSKSFTKNHLLTELIFVDAFIYKNINEDKELKKWLNEELDVKYPKNIDILHKSVFPKIKKDSITVDNTLKITNFIFNLYTNGELTDKDYNTLKNIKLLTNNGLKPAQDVYFSDIYAPILKLEELIPKQSYLSEKYITNERDTENLKNFLLRLSVKEKITFIPYGKERSKLIELIPEAENYLTWIDKNDFYDSIYSKYKHKGQHSVSNFRYTNLLNYLSEFLFAKQFWDIILNNWDSYSFDSPKTMYHHFGGKDEIPDYLSYYIRNFSSIPATDEKCYISTDVYSPKFKNIVRDKYPVAKFKTSQLSKEKLDYLKLKQFIEIDDCISILISLVQEEVTHEVKKQIFALYKEILKSYEDGNRISVDISAITLLTINNTYQQIDNLHYFGISSQSPSVNSDNFIQLPEFFEDKDKQLFCEIFKISIVTHNDLNFTYENHITDNSLKNKINEILPYLTVIIAHKKSLDFDDEFAKLKSVINSISFYKANKLTLTYTNDKDEVIFDSEIKIWHFEDSIFFSQNWKNPLLLYNLCSLLSDYLKVENIDREIVLFLQISKTEITDWLTEKGYEIPELRFFQEKCLNVDESQLSMETNEPANLKSIATNEEFKPEVEANLADTKNVKINNISHESVNYAKVSKDYTKLKNKKIKINIGRWSEEYIYQYLKKQYKDSPIRWLNKDEESYLPYDFIVTEKQKEIYIEVKGTPSKDKGEFYMSKKEWNLMFEKKENYSIYRLFNAGKKEGLEIKIIAKPYLLIQNGNMLPNSILVYI